MASCGAVVGTAMIVAISPSWLSVAGATAAMPGVRGDGLLELRELRLLVPASPFGVSTASRNGPLEPGPKASLSSS